jgi:hypothetical protein
MRQARRRPPWHGRIPSCRGRTCPVNSTGCRWSLRNHPEPDSVANDITTNPVSRLAHGHLRATPGSAVSWPDNPGICVQRLTVREKIDRIGRGQVSMVTPERSAAKRSASSYAPRKPARKRQSEHSPNTHQVSLLAPAKIDVGQQSRAARFTVTTKNGKRIGELTVSQGGIYWRAVRQRRSPRIEWEHLTAWVAAGAPPLDRLVGM